MTGIAFIIIGLVLLADWRGLGTRYYRWHMRMPFWNLYEQWGARHFRVLAGVGAVLGGLMFTIVATVNLA